MTVLIDSNVLLDIITEDPTFLEWSSRTLEEVADSARVVINAVIYAETSVRFMQIEDVDDVLAEAGIERVDIPFEAAFLAGKAFAAYRKRSGVKTAVLSDFFIGAHAAVAGYRLMTRDISRVRTYFPQVRLITPIATN
ncbi:MAG: type II toxin-antitoxin system VapC family toxin [Micropepsaceae bacterium]